MEPNDLQGLSFQDFIALVDSKVEETSTLEFKRKPSPDVELQKADKTLLGEAISGFANATGGNLVVGIATEKRDGIDCASKLIEIDHVQAVANRYRSYLPNCTSPPVEGVTVRAVKSSGDRGIMVIHVPKGQARPHMSRAPGHHTYYRRVIDAFPPMEAYEVEEMMRLKTAPKLTLVSELRHSGSTGGNRQFDLVFGLANFSRVTAKFPYVEYLKVDGQPHVSNYGLDGNGNTLWPKIQVSSVGILFAAGADNVIHPGQRLFVSRIPMREGFAAERPGAWGLSTLADGEVMKLRFDFGCEDCPKETGWVELSKEYLAAFVRKAADP